MGEDRVSEVWPLTSSLSLSISLCVPASLPLFLFVFFCLLLGSVFLCLCFFLWHSVSLFHTFVTPFLARCHISDSLSLLLPLLFHSCAPSYTCPHLPCQEGNFALFPTLAPAPLGSRQPEVFAPRLRLQSCLAPAAVAACRCPFRGRGSGWGGSGVELGQESTGCIRAASGRSPAAPPSRGRAGLCNG